MEQSVNRKWAEGFVGLCVSSSNVSWCSQLLVQVTIVCSRVRLGRVTWCPCFLQQQLPAIVCRLLRQELHLPVDAPSTYSPPSCQVPPSPWFSHPMLFVQHLIAHVLLTAIESLLSSCHAWWLLLTHDSHSDAACCWCFYVLLIF